PDLPDPQDDRAGRLAVRARARVHVGRARLLHVEPEGLFRHHPTRARRGGAHRRVHGDAGVSPNRAASVTARAGGDCAAHVPHRVERVGDGVGPAAGREHVHRAGRAVGFAERLPRPLGLLRGGRDHRLGPGDGALPWTTALLPDRPDGGWRQRLSLHRIVVVGGALVAILALVAIIFVPPPTQWTADSPPAVSPGPDHWTTGNKDAIGAAYGRQSNVWFTAVHG